jgi:cytochrome c oxidase subunit 2
VGVLPLAPPVIDTRHEFAGLFSIYEWLMVGVAAIVLGAVTFALVRYRHGRAGAPSGRSEANAAESVYAVVIAVIVAGLVAATFHTESRVDPLAANASLLIRITAFDWQWRFDYPNGKSLVGKPGRPAQLVVPAHREIEFEATSRDVIHSFWVPSLRFKRDAFPNRITRFDLVFDRAGVFPGRCAEFCGLHHADMTFRVHVLEPAEFDAWSRE